MRALIRSRGALVHAPCLDQELLAAAVRGEDLDWSPATALEVLEDVPAGERAGVLLVDVTAARDMTPVYRAALEAGFGVVSANKLPFCGPLEGFKELEQVRRSTGRPLLHECTVGASLPVVGPARSLVESGEGLTGFLGVVSGTLGYLATEVQAGRAFSVAVGAARDAGYTEPDPREDLGGLDVARKTLILARIAGAEVELGDVEVESLVPPELADASIEAFLAGLEAADPGWSARMQAGRAGGQVLRYTGGFGPEGLYAGLETFAEDSPWGSLEGTDNLVGLHTGSSTDRTIWIRGAGAGPIVTAWGVLQDVLRAAERG